MLQRDRLRALEYVDELIAVYNAQAGHIRRSAESEQDATKRMDLDNSARSCEAVAERLAHVRAVVDAAITSAKRPRRRSGAQR